MANEEPGSEASGWGKREREEYLAQVAEEVRGGGRLGGGGIIDSLFPIYFMSIVERRRRGTERPLRDGDLWRIRSGE